ncbi:MAG TPA: tetratricopeptide repeat protein [Thermodesulfobacteriaceae bacterium]|nr:tetratricopeptide repeat protein [Thermodesulfobacteriaceae bacterium]
MTEQHRVPIDDHTEKPKNEWEELLSGLPSWIREPLKNYYREILAGLTVVLLAAGLFSGYSAYTDSQENKAAGALGSTMNISDSRTRIKAIQEVAGDHENTAAGRQALLILANEYRDAGDMDSAGRNFSKAMEIYPADSIFYQAAVIGLGYMAEDKGEMERAAETYRKLTEHELGFEDVATLDLARVYQVMGKHEEALAAYNGYISDEPDSQMLDFVRNQVMKLSSLEKD